MTTLLALLAGALVTLAGASPASAAQDDTCAGSYERKATTTGNWSATATWGGSAAPTSAQNACIPTGITVTIGNGVAAVARSINGGGTLSINGNNSTSFTLGAGVNSADSWIGTLNLLGSGNGGATGFAGIAPLSIGTFNWTNHQVPVTGSGPLTIRTAWNPTTAAATAVSMPRSVTIASGATATFDGPPAITFTGSGRTFTNNGTVVFSTTANNLAFDGGYSFVNNGTLQLTGAVTMSRNTGSGTFTNNPGATIVKDGSGVGTINLAATNNGTLDLQSGGLNFTAGLTQPAGTSTVLNSGESLTVVGGYTNSGGGAVTLEAGSTMTVTGGDYVQTGSTSRTIVEGALTVSGAGNDVDIQAGALQGGGSISAETVRNAALLRPGASAAASLDIAGNFVQTSTGTSRFDVWSGAPSTVGVSGTASLAGKLGTSTWGTTPSEGASFNALTYASRTGAFTDLWDVLIGNGPSGLVYEPNQGGTATSLTVVDIPVVTVDDVSVSEGTGGTTNATFTVTRSGSTAVPVSVRAATAAFGSNKATAGTDYTTVSQVKTLAAGVSSATVVVPITTDSFGELAETYQVKLSAPKNVHIADLSGLGTITNDDGPAPSFSVADVTTPEGSGGNHVVDVTITRDGDAAEAVSVKWKTRSGTAKSTTGDFTSAASTVVTFAAGETTKTVGVTVNGDTTVEPSEAFTVVLERPVGGSIADASATVTLTNDD